MAPVSRREFLGYTAALPFLLQFHELAAAQRKRVKIRDVQVMMLEGGRTYTLVKITADDGLFGIAEAYGSPGVGVKEQILSLKPWLVGKDPLEIDALYTDLGVGTRNLSGTRTDGSAHNLIRAVSGIEMALWDLAGKILDVPTSTLLGGKFRDRVRVYDHAAPKNMLDKGACKEWAAQVKGTSERLHVPQVRVPAHRPEDRPRPRSVESHADDQRADQHPAGIRELPRGDRMGPRHHGPLPLGVRPAHVDSDRRRDRVDQAGLARRSAAGRLLGLVEAAVRELEGADLHGREPRAPRGIQGLHPESGLPTSCIPICAIRAGSSRPSASPISRTSSACRWPRHNTGSQVNTYATCQWAASIRDYMSCETVTGEGGWMDQVLVLDGPYIKDGFIQVSSKPGLGITLNPDVVKAHLAAGETWWG